MSNFKGSLAVEAPGKVVLMGEYAALEGHPAVVMAVNRYAQAYTSPAVPQENAILSAVRQHIEALNLPPNLHAELAAKDFFHVSGQKIGMGASAALTVATTGFYFEQAGLNIEQNLSSIYSCAFKAHQALQSGGSGIDILSCTYGGVLVSSYQNAAFQRLQAPSLPMAFIGTCKSASTPMLIKAYQAHKQACHKIIEKIQIITQQFIQAWQTNDHLSLLQMVEQSFLAYQLLEKIIGYQLITTEHNFIHHLAKKHGGEAKPSGAGGGDLAVAFFPTTDKLQQFCNELPSSCTALDLSVSTSGVNRIKTASE